MAAVKDAIKSSDSAESKTTELTKTGTTDAVETTKEETPGLRPYPFKEFCGDLLWTAKSLFNNPDFTPLLMLPLLIFESIASQIIINSVPYTEIDYSTYMQQIEKIEEGERDYCNIYGDTGALVYPGGHVWIFHFLKRVSNNMDDIRAAQVFFRLLYVFTLLLVFICYYMTGIKIPPYVLYLLVLSKRIHSIYVLRMFNDCFTTLFAVASVLTLIYAANSKKYNVSTASSGLTYTASAFLSVAVSIKMNALLYLPGFLVVAYYLCDENLLKSVPVVLFGVAVQVLVNYPFLFTDAETRKHFFDTAFDFSREFLYKWTVNWKFVPEEIFSSRLFHYYLLVLQVAFLLGFLVNRWASMTVTGKSVSEFFTDAFKKPFQSTIKPVNVIFTENGTNFVMWTMTLSNLIGVLFARSLHYQFLSWYFYSLPYLLYSAGLPFYIIIPLAAIHEVCWDTFPATAGSSLTLVIILATVVVSNYVKNDFAPPQDEKKTQ